MLEMHAQVFGNVQGVGFRHTCRSIASRLGLNGYARNMPDGSVEIHAQGEKKELEKLISSLKEEFKGYIEEVAFEFVNPQTKYEGFIIRV